MKYTAYTVEEVTALYYNSDAIKSAPKEVSKIEVRGDRYYYDPYTDSPTLYPSVTTIISKTLKRSQFLIEWIANKGIEAAREYMNERADYGSLLHWCIADMLRQRNKFDLSKLGQRVVQYLYQVHRSERLADQWRTELEKDILAFAQFVHDYNVRPLFIELPLINKRGGYAGSIDLVCMMDVPVKGFHGARVQIGPNQGKPKETTEKVSMRCIVDFKSGRNSFYEDHEVQLEGYRRMYNIHYRNMPIDRLYNWRPKDWQKEPGYALKNQTDAPNIGKFPLLLKIGKIEMAKREPTAIVCEGKINANLGTSDNFRLVPLSGMRKPRKTKKRKK